MSTRSSSPFPRTHSGVMSETATAVDVNATIDPKKSPQLPPQAHPKPEPFSELGQTPSRGNGMSDVARTQTHATIATLPDGVKLSQRHKWSLLGVFSLSLFIDIWSYSAFFIFVSVWSDA